MGFYKKITSLIKSQSKGTASFEEAERSMRLQTKESKSGNYVYEEDSFTFQHKNKVVKIRWDDIEKLIAYKVDLITTDDICLTIFSSAGQVTINEETPGWAELNQKIKKNFPCIPDNWENQIAFSPFARNETILFQR